MLVLCIWIVYKYNLLYYPGFETSTTRSYLVFFFFLVSLENAYSVVVAFVFSAVIATRTTHSFVPPRITSANEMQKRRADHGGARIATNGPEHAEDWSRLGRFSFGYTRFFFFFYKCIRIRITGGDPWSLWKINGPKAFTFETARNPFTAREFSIEKPRVEKE